MSKGGIFGTNLKVCLVYDLVQYSYLFYLRIINMLMNAHIYAILHVIFTYMLYALIL